MKGRLWVDAAAVKVHLISKMVELFWELIFYFALALRGLILLERLSNC